VSLCKNLFSSIIRHTESLFSGSASNERKYWGFVVFQRVLPRVKAADLPMLFTKNFMRTWINHLSHFDRYLHSFAKQIASPDASYPLLSVYADCQASQAKEILSAVQKDPALGYAFILPLTGVHGSQQFDKLTRTTTVESILTRMSAEGIKNYITHLLGQADGGLAFKQYGVGPFQKVVDYSLRARSDTQDIDARRSWIIEQFAALIRKGTTPKSDEWVQMILDWFVVHGIFTIKKKSQKSSISTVCTPPLFPIKVWLSHLDTQIHYVPSPPYSDHLRRQCRERLLGCLADLTQLSIVTKTAEKVQRFTGITSDGQLWLSRVVQIIWKLEQDTKHVALLSELDQDDRGKLEHARRTVAWLSKVRPSFVLLFFSSEISVC
jgi:DNA polymerase phi